MNSGVTKIFNNLCSILMMLHQKYSLTKLKLGIGLGSHKKIGIDSGTGEP